jgi:hypothetical protein
MAKIEASAIHKQHISVTLRVLEQTLGEVEREITTAPLAASLITYCDPVPEGVAASLLALAAEARQEIATLANDLDLPRHEESLRRALLGELHARVIKVVELQPKYLRSGGAVPPPLAEYIGSKAARLEKILRQMIQMLEISTREGPD